MAKQKIMSPKEVSEYIGIGLSTLALWRATGTGPQYIKILRRLVRYRKDEVDKWLNGQTSEIGGKPLSA